MHDIVHELVIRATPARTYQAVTDPDDLQRWWASEVEVDVANGELRLEVPDEGAGLRFEVDTVAAPEMAHLTCLDGPEEWPGTELAFRIEESRDGSGSVLRFWHGGWEYEDGVLPRASFRWAMRLDALRAYLEGGPPGA